MTIFTRLARLSPAERRVIADGLILLPLVRIGLLILPLGAVQKRCERALAGVAPPATVFSLAPKRIVRLVHLVSRLVPGAHCLPRALVAQILLRRRGFPAELHLGVRKADAGRLDAHAWVELGGRPLMEDDAALKDYASFSKAFVSTPKDTR